MGYGLIEDGVPDLRALDYGVLTAPSSMAPALRLHRLYTGLMQVVANYEPDEIAVEEPFVAQTARQNARSALAVGRAQAIAMLVAAGNSIPLYTYLPARVKQVVTDHGGSNKEQVQRMVQMQLQLNQAPRPSDAADALAVAVCHARERRLAEMVARNERRQP